MGSWAFDPQLQSSTCSVQVFVLQFQRFDELFNQRFNEFLTNDLTSYFAQRFDKFWINDFAIFLRTTKVCTVQVCVLKNCLEFIYFEVKF